MIEYEHQFQVDINENHQLAHLSPEMRSLYDKIELQKQQYLTNQSLLSKMFLKIKLDKTSRLMTVLKRELKVRDFLPV